ncbi:MAG: asparagine synthase (glutamine-hydrolyzing) [Bacteroidales bacterium]|nr:asparagine synthase (glutamine-hydrolyzing) [Bacteroidales bacterium]
MCGIAGFYSLKNKFLECDLRQMAERLKHRGPDAEGFFINHPIGLAHKRLSIIDLSTAANQPMTSQNNRYVIVFNGEIYNYLEIRKELHQAGSISLKTNSDTETLLEGFALWGTSVFEKLCGMFAFAIFDKKEKTLYLCRDRAGIKPLYIFNNDGEIAFSSELKSLTSVPLIRQNLLLNNVAINEYLYLGYIPEPNSIYKSIQKFPAGHWACIKNGELIYQKYWSVQEKIQNETLNDEIQAKTELKNLLKKIIKEHMICDVPYGSFLSGGIDSSLVSAIANEVSNSPLHTFSVGFEESKHNESHYAKKVATHLGTIHHELMVTEKEALNLIPDLMTIYDEPFADSSAIPTYLISKLSKQHVSMTLSGDGGDELFLGYGAYFWAKRLRNPFLRFNRHLIAYGLSMLNSRYKRAAHLFAYPKIKNLKSHIFSQEQYLFSTQEVENILNSPFITDITLNESYSGLQRILSDIEQQSIFDINYYLKDDLLVKVDRASMQHALEVRVPLLDHRLIEFATNLNLNLRLKNKTTKYLLKQVLFEYVPKDFFERPKWGFSIPLEKWMKKELKPYIYDNLSESVVNYYGIVKIKEVQKLLRLFETDNHAYLYNRIWVLAVLHDFLKKNNPIN